MKKRIILIAIMVIGLFTITGCGSTKETPKKQEEKKEEVKTNSTVGMLKFYVPEDYTYKPDLRGLVYKEDEKKVYMKGDYENDPDNVIALVVYLNKLGKGVKQYTDEINEKFTEKDVFYVIKPNGKITDLYARENYIISGKINYAYMMDNGGYIYVANIQGPKDKENDIKDLVGNVYKSLTFK